MGKYIWPGRAAEAAKWYLEILSGKRKLSIDALMAEQIQSRYRNRTRQQTYRQLEYLQHKGLVNKSGSYRYVNYRITNKGLAFLESLKLSKIQPSDRWDRKWRLVMFDIPEQKRIARDNIRRLLKELGFKQLQLSVWVHPLPCPEQFKIIQQAYGITDHLFLVQTETFNIPSPILRHFQQAYPKLKIR